MRLAYPSGIASKQRMQGASVRPLLVPLQLSILPFSRHFDLLLLAASLALRVFTLGTRLRSM
jgi:hypothetical protein